MTEKEFAYRQIEFADSILEYAAELERQAHDWRALAGKILCPPEGTTVEFGYGNGGWPLVRFVTGVRDAA